MHLHPGFTGKRRWHYSLDESTSAQELAILHVFRLTFDFFPHEFAAYSKPPSSDNHRKVSYPKTHNVTSVRVVAKIMRLYGCR